MLDCPEQSHTSPSNTSFNVILFFPTISIVYGPPAFIAGRNAIHLPSVPAFVLAFLPLNLILTFSPLEAQPQILSFVSLCNTILSRTIRGRVICALEKRKKRKKLITR